MPTRNVKILKCFLVEMVIKNPKKQQYDASTEFVWNGFVDAT
jgi:hypothetical protein